MRLSELLIPSRLPGDDRNDLLAYAGYTHRLADGLYSLLPLGHRVLRRIRKIVRQEMAGVGAQELTMPLLQPELLWRARAEMFGPQLFRLASDGEERLILAPTHEEVASVLAAACIQSARDLPRIFYQIQPRFRDQACTGGLMQTREFVMADAYSFHAAAPSLNETYAAIRQAFATILFRCGVSAEIVSADPGPMGGEESEEFIAMLPNAAGISAVRCPGCGYAASIELAEFKREPTLAEAPASMEEVAVPNGSKRLNQMPFIAGGRVLLAVTTADRDLNTVKLLHAASRAGMDTTGFHQAAAEELLQLGGNYDWISLVRTPASILIIADEAVRSGANFFIPSTRTGHFLINVNAGRDFRIDLCADLSVAREGDACPRCGNAIRGVRGTEVGHIFKLGRRYAAAFGAEIRDAAGARPLEMGCYGLGLTRLMATIVEQRRDARGIVWPESVAPFAAVVVPEKPPGEISGKADELYVNLTESGLDVLIDDSVSNAEEKLLYADLLGIPLQIIVSSDSENVQVRERATSQNYRVPAAELARQLKKNL